MTNLPKLLERWSELEPERCQLDKITGIWYVRRWGTMRKASLIDRLDEDRIRGAVEESIESHGWDWSLETDAKGYFSEVPAQNVHSGGDTPTEALLTAYLQALEVTAGVTG